MLLNSDPKRGRITTVIACTAIALACGTNVRISSPPAPTTADQARSMDTQSGVLVLRPASSCLLRTVTSSYEPPTNPQKKSRD